MTGIFELENPKIKGQFCLLALRHFCKDYGITLTDFESKVDLSDLFAVSDLVYYSCLAYAELNDEKLDFNKSQFTNIFGQIDQKDLENLVVPKLMELELFGQKLNPSVGDSKKKAPETKS